MYVDATAILAISIAKVRRMQYGLYHEYNSDRTPVVVVVVVVVVFGRIKRQVRHMRRKIRRKGKKDIICVN